MDGNHLKYDNLDKMISIRKIKNECLLIISKEMDILLGKEYVFNILNTSDNRFRDLL